MHRSPELRKMASQVDASLDAEQRAADAEAAEHARQRYEELIRELPSCIMSTYAYTEEAMDMQRLLASRMKKLPSSEFERVLHPAFEEDEWKLIAIGGLLGVLCTLCFFLLALRIGGQTDYAAWLIALPIFGALALAACCCGCLACLAGVVARAQQMGGAGAGHPPYHPVGDEEAEGGGDVTQIQLLPRATRQIGTCHISFLKKHRSRQKRWHRAIRRTRSGGRIPP